MVRFAHRRGSAEGAPAWPIHRRSATREDPEDQFLKYHAKTGDLKFSLPAGIWLSLSVIFIFLPALMDSILGQAIGSMTAVLTAVCIQLATVVYFQRWVALYDNISHQSQRVECSFCHHPYDIQIRPKRCTECGAEILGKNRTIVYYSSTSKENVIHYSNIAKNIILILMLIFYGVGWAMYL